MRQFKNSRKPFKDSPTQPKPTSTWGWHSPHSGITTRLSPNFGGHWNWSRVMPTRSSNLKNSRLAQQRIRERLKKFCGHSGRGFLGFGEALAKEQVQSNPPTEPKRSQNPKRPPPTSFTSNSYSISENALKGSKKEPSPIFT